MKDDFFGRFLYDIVCDWERIGARNRHELNFVSPKLKFTIHPQEYDMNQQWNRPNLKKKYIYIYIYIYVYIIYILHFERGNTLNQHLQ